MEHLNQLLSTYTANAKCMNFYIHTLTPENVQKGLHRHDFFQMILLEEGTITHFVDFSKYKMEPQTVSVIFPHQVHCMELSPDARATLVFFDPTVFCSEILRNDLKDYNIDLQKKINFVSFQEHPEAFQELLSLVKFIRKNYEQLNPVRKMQIKLSIKIMLLQIIDALPENVTPSANETDTILYSRFREQVDLQFMEQRKVQYYAQMLGVSTKKLTMVCQHYSGNSPLEIIHEKLSLELKKALALDELSFKEIAYSFGFSSQSALNKYIGQKFGKTPLAFREELRQRIIGKK